MPKTTLADLHLDGGVNMRTAPTGKEFVIRCSCNREFADADKGLAESLQRIHAETAMAVATSARFGARTLAERFRVELETQSLDEFLTDLLADVLHLIDAFEDEEAGVEYTTILESAQRHFEEERS